MGTEIFLFLNIGTQEMMLILVVALFLFGGKKLPELARGLGRGIREFKDASESIKKDISEQINNFEEEIDVVKSDVKSITEGVLEDVSIEEEELIQESSVEEHVSKPQESPVNLEHQNDIDHSDQYYQNYDYEYPEEDISSEPLEDEPILEERIVHAANKELEDGIDEDNTGSDTQKS